MSILSVAMVVVTLVSPIFISAVQSLSERLACANIYISKVFGEMPAFKIDGILKKLDQWPVLHTSYIKLSSASTPVPSEPDIACPGTDNFHHMNHSLFDPGLSELGSLWRGQISQDAVSTSEHHANVPTFGGLYREALLINRPVLLFIMIVLLLIPAVASIFTWYSRKHCLQVANIEILDFINEVRARKAFLLKRMSSAVSMLNSQIDSIVRQIVMEHERVCAELPTFLDVEVRELREALETQFRNEFDHHVLEVKNFADNLERARRSFPDPEAIEAECEDFQSELQRWRQRMGDFLAQVSAEAERNGNMQSPVKRIMEHQEEMPPTQACVTETEDEVMEDKVERNEPASHIVSEKPRAEDEEPISRMALWATASGHPAPTPAEIEEGRRIRRERVAKRMEENNGQRPVRSQSGPRKRRCPFRNRRHSVHKQDHDAARQSSNSTSL
ncbi:uncharacterized protein CDV56_108966 [Aspergillus thermomutatus]|uniref:Uncharacterized protein n=1 Tax=Aspergillus thermomutatus TaxID=41047 RepID=A0A397HYQ5_ASPTH|nr:uncharacterized protein CDV56_108966 [Aspergillus thermomutatus]RHZ68142.1 hypothetical protein CDV56_108966 [Aspergillus thermomutatus]